MATKNKHPKRRKPKQAESAPELTIEAISTCMSGDGKCRYYTYSNGIWSEQSPVDTDGTVAWASTPKPKIVHAPDWLARIIGLSAWAAIVIIGFILLVCSSRVAPVQKQSSGIACPTMSREMVYRYDPATKVYYKTPFHSGSAGVDASTNGD